MAVAAVVVVHLMQMVPMVQEVHFSSHQSESNNRWMVGSGRQLNLVMAAAAAVSMVVHGGVLEVMVQTSGGSGGSGSDSRYLDSGVQLLFGSGRMMVMDISTLIYYWNIHTRCHNN